MIGARFLSSPSMPAAIAAKPRSTGWPLSSMKARTTAEALLSLRMPSAIRPAPCVVAWRFLPLTASTAMSKAEGALAIASARISYSRTVLRSFLRSASRRRIAKLSSTWDAMRPRLIADMLDTNESLSFSSAWTSFFTISRTGFCIFSRSAGTSFFSSSTFATTSAGSAAPVDVSYGATSSAI